MQFTHLERRCGLVSDEEAVAVAVCHWEDLVVHPRVDRLDEGRVKLDHCSAIDQVSGTGVLKPVHRRLDSRHGDSPLAAVHRHDGGLRASATEVAVGIYDAAAACPFSIEWITPSIKGPPN